MKERYEVNYMGFMNEIKNEASKVLTENGAVGYSTTG